jgi:predicted nucleic acid-binding protein
VILVDTSGLLAAVDPRQQHHAEAAQILLQPQRRVLSPLVLAELDYLIGTNAGQAEALKLLRDVARGVYQIEPFDTLDVSAAIAVIERYADLRLGIADASIVVRALR